MIDDEKNIDRLFQEKFKDFEATPGNDLWNNIEAKLNEEEDKKVIPLFPWWLKRAGVAAVILIALGLATYFNPFQKKDDISESPQNTVVEINSKNSKDTDIIATEKEQNSISESDQNTEGQVPNKLQTEKENFQEANKSSAIVSSSKSHQNTYASYNNSKESMNVAKNAGNKYNAQKNKYYKELNPNAGLRKEMKFSNGGKENSSNRNTQLSENNTDTQKKGNINSTNFNIESDAIIDSLINETAVAKEETLDDVLEKIKKDQESEEDEDEGKNNGKKWSISPNMAPVYFGSLTKGSPISSEFSNNSKSGNVNLSYGINVGMEINKKFSIRSGVNRVQYGYATNGVYFNNNALSARNISSINYSNSGDAIMLSNTHENQGLVAELQSNVSIGNQEGELIQNINYIEVPLELTYNVFDKKFGLNIVGGVSTLLLSDNEILLRTGNDLVTSVGDANNINSLNFSTNIGLGLNYNFSKSLLLNVEPMFKYQLNTFSNNNGFNPYSLGIYTGFSFRF